MALIFSAVLGEFISRKLLVHGVSKAWCDPVLVLVPGAKSNSEKLEKL